MLSSIGAKIPVGNSDAGSYFNNQVLSAVDYGVCTRLILLRATVIQARMGRWPTYIHGLQMSLLPIQQRGPQISSRNKILL